MEHHEKGEKCFDYNNTTNLNFKSGTIPAWLFFPLLNLTLPKVSKKSLKFFLFKDHLIWMEISWISITSF